MNKAKKILALVLVLVMTVNLFTGVGLVTTQAATTGQTAAADFTETFTNGMSGEWENDAAGHIYGGLYHADRFLVNRYYGAQNTTKYIIKADVTFNRYFNGEAYQTGFTGIAARYDLSANSGYELAVGALPENDDLVARFAKRVNGSIENNYIMLGTVAKVGDTVNLSIAVYGNTILCYVNHALIYETEDTTFAQGYPAMVNGDAQGVYDNFTYSTFAPEGYNFVKTVAFSGEKEFTFANSANWDPNFTFEGQLQIKEPLDKAQDIFGNEIIVDESYWDEGAEAPEQNYTPVYGGVLGADTAVAEAELLLRGDLRAHFLLNGQKRIIFTVYMGSQKLYSEDLGRNKVFALQVVSASDSVQILVDGVQKYTYSGSLLGAMGLKTTNAVGKLYGISFTTHDIPKRIISKGMTVVKKGTNPADVADFALTYESLAGETKTGLLPQQIIGYDAQTPVGEHKVQLTYNQLATYCDVIVVDDTSRYAFDNFDNASTIWGNSSAVNQLVTDGKLTIDSNLTGGRVTGSDNWTNYTVQADVCVTGHSTAEGATGTQFMGIYSRKGTNGIEFALLAEAADTASYARLYFRGAGHNAGEYATGKFYPKGKTYNLRLDVYGDEVKAYINDELVFHEYIPNVSATEYKSGAAGLTLNGKGTVDNFRAGILTAEEFGVQQPTTPDEATTAFIEAVKAQKAAGVKRDQTNALIKQYAALTLEQKAQIPAYTIHKYEDMIASAERALSGLSDTELLYMDDFDTSEGWDLEESDPFRVQDGVLLFSPTDDDTLLAEYAGVIEQDTHNIVGQTRYISADFKVTTVDMKTASNGTDLEWDQDGFAGIYAFHSSAGYYHLRLQISQKALNLQLYRFVSSEAGELLGSAKVSGSGNILTDYFYKTEFPVSYNLSVLATDTHIYGYYNGEKKITYAITDTDRPILNTLNTAGVRILKARTEVDNLVVLGTRMDRVKKEYTEADYAEYAGTYTAGTYYRDDFEKQTVGAAPNTWLQDNYSLNWKVQKEKALTDDLLFFEDFTTAPAWVNNGNVASGVFTSNEGANQKISVLDNADMDEFVFEADVALLQDDEGRNVTGAICFKNYEFGIYIESNVTGCRFYDRNTNPNTKAAYGYIVREKMPINWNESVHLTLIYKGGKFSGHINGECVFTIDDPGHYTGSTNAISLRSTVYKATFDNVKITVPNNAAAGTNNVYVYDAVNGSKNLSWLHTFDTAPIISAKVKVANVRVGAQVGLITRYAVEDSFIKAGYDFDAKKWFISYTPGREFETKTVYANATSTFEAETWYTLDLVTTGSNVYLSVNGDLVLSCVADYVGLGRVALYANNLTAAFDDAYAYSPMAAPIDSGIVEQAMWDDAGNYGELEILEEVVNGYNVILATRNDLLLASFDGGVTFTTNHKYTVQKSPLGYLSTLKTYDANGNFVNYVSVGYQYVAYVSTDFVTWEPTSYILPPIREEKDEEGNVVNTYYYEEGTDTEMDYKTFKGYALDHISSFGLVDIGTGTPRIIMPIGVRYKNTGTDAIVGHYTRTFYSDDYGYTWKESVNNTRDITAYADATDRYASFCEAKLVGTGTQTVYMYCTRKWSPYVHCLRSLDGGVTWDPNFFYEQKGQGSTGYAMPTATASFGVAQDPLNPGTYYMVYVKDVPYSPTAIWPRNHLVLAKTTNGLDWEEVMTLDRYTSTPHPLSDELYQFLDPNVLVTEDYIFATYGRSDEYMAGAHNKQYTRYYRVARGNTVTVDSDMQGILSVSKPLANKGDTVTVTVNLPKDAQLKAGTLKVYSADRKNSMKIITQPAQILAGTGLGNTFEFTMPASDVIIDAELMTNLSTADTNFSVAVLAAAYKSGVSAGKDGLRYLSRMYLPSDGFGNLKLDVSYGGKQYTIVGFGSLYAATGTLGTTTLDMAAVKLGKAKAVAAYPNGKLYDLNAGFVDFTVRLVGTTTQLQTAYSVRTYVELQDASGKITYVYSDDTISRSYADFH